MCHPNAPPVEDITKANIEEPAQTGSTGTFPPRRSALYVQVTKIFRHGLHSVYSGWFGETELIFFYS